jgi:dipeptidase D
MDLKLEDLAGPPRFWVYFKEVSAIPRCSGKEGRIRSYIEEVAESFHYNTNMDTAGNLLAYQESLGKSSNEIKIIFQCHMDMVCEKNKDISHDFSKDTLSLRVLEEDGEKWVTAEGTTLGADNGVGIAYCLTLMEFISNKRLEFPHLSIRFLFTVEEEVGLKGVIEMDPDFIDGNYLINLDSEDDTKFTIGCAGGINTSGSLKVNFKDGDQIPKKLIPIQLKIRGLRGGHSGVDINKGRANSIKILSKILWKVNNTYGIYLGELKGGNLSNAIPREAEATFYCRKGNNSKVFKLINQIKSQIELGISKIEPNMKISWKALEKVEQNRIFSKITGDKLLHMLYVMPNGPISIHPKNPELVYTSTNLASIKMSGNRLEIVTSQRSLHEISKTIIFEKVEALMRLADLGIEVKHEGDYPAWEPNYNSKLLEIAKKSYQNLFEKEPEIQTIHAGLETGILKKKISNMEMLSLGPVITGGHSPDEKLQVESVKKIWKLLSKLLKNVEMTI